MNARFCAMALVALMVHAGCSDSVFAGVRGKSYNITGQNIIDGAPIQDVYRFHVNNVFTADSNPIAGTWNELDLLLFSIYIAGVELSPEPAPTGVGIIGLSAGNQITGLGLLKVGPLLIISGTFSGTQLP